MESWSDQPPLIAIVGETASGKSALALKLAQHINGEIIAADSRTIYRGLNIGTAKPTVKDQQAVPHHLLDIVSPAESYSVADFRKEANQVISDIARRGRTPLLVGGSGLYIDAVLYDFSFRKKADEQLRQHLQGLTVDELQGLLLEQGLDLPENSRNPRHLIRAMETKGAVSEKKPLRDSSLVIGLYIDRETLRQKVRARVETMVEQGLIDEVRQASEQYGWDAPALQAPGYKAFRQYIEGAISLEAAKELFVRADLQLAKRQRTWFKRNQDIHWVKSEEEAVDLVTTFLNK